MSPAKDEITNVLYFGYGSNMRSTVMENRGIEALGKKIAYIPSHVLNFEVFGVPYSEPAMASIGCRRSKGDEMSPPVHGVVTLISEEDYHKLLKSEGAGTAYMETELEAITIKPVATEQETEINRGERVMVKTLVARYPFRSHNPARPSRRYLNLLLDGAKENSLPESYQEYLQSLPTYCRPMTRGGAIFQSIWLPLIQGMMNIIKSNHERAPHWADKETRRDYTELFECMIMEGLDVSRINTDSNECDVIPSWPAKLYLEKARWLLGQFPLIDGHNDFPFLIRGYYGSKIYKTSWSMERLPIGQTDLVRLRQGQVGGQFWSAFVPCPTEKAEFSDDFSTATLLPALLSTLQQLDVIHTFIADNPGSFALAGTSSDILPIFESGRIASLIGIEGLHQVANSASVLRMFHRLGVRYATLNHATNTIFSDSSKPETHPHRGLSPIGRELIREMNRIGMLIDLSHTSFATQRDVLEWSKAPVIFSHSSCYALTPNVRNVTDEILKKLRSNGGLLMVCFLPSLVMRSGGRPATVDSVADHIVHAGEIMGYEHVGIGSDFDGMLEGPENLDDVRGYPLLVAHLLWRGVSDQDVENICGKNLIRVMRMVEEAAKGWEKGNSGTGGLVDDIGGVWTDAEKELVKKMGEKRQIRKEY